MRSLDLDSLEIFRSVAREGGVLRAADKLHRVPSNITTRVKQLEARLGVALFRRQGRRLVLTAEGQGLLQQAERLLRLADEVEQSLRTGEGGGPLRLGSLESTAGSRLPALLSRYHRLHPQVVIELQTGTTGALLQRVRGFQLEAAFVSEPFSAPDLQAQPVFDEELVLITARDQPPLRSAAELGRATLIAFAQGCSYRQRLQEWCAASCVLPERVLEFASYPAIIACVAAGTGCAIVPVSVLQALRAAADVRQHELPPAIRRNRTHLVWSGEPSPALQKLQALLDAPQAAARRAAAKPAAAAGQRPRVAAAA